MRNAGFTTVWEPASGEDYLVKAMELHGFRVLGTDILFGVDYFDSQPWIEFDCSVTNPPYSIKYDWIERSYEIGKPWALLMPVEAHGAYAAQKLFQAHEPDIQIIYVSPRIDFKMPEKGWNGKGAQFPTAWYTWKFDLPKDNNYYRLNKVKYGS